MQKEILVKTIDQLDAKIQTKVIQRMRYNFDFCWNDEYINTLQKFCDLFNCEIKDYSLGDSHCTIKISYPSDTKHIAYLQLHKYLMNYYFKDLFKPKYLKRINNKSIYSKVQRESYCVLTGFCADDDILKPVYDFIKKPYKVDLEDLIRECIDSFIVAYQDDIYNYYSDESIKELLVINECLFTIDGIMV